MKKIVSLVISLTIISISLFAPYEWYNVGIYANAPWGNRWIYLFFHAGLFHALLNAWCLLSIVFIYNISCIRMLLAWIVAACVPNFLMDCQPTVGMSVSVFFLLGSISFEVQRWRYFQFVMLLYLLMGFLLPDSNGLLHLYGYVCGLGFALLNKPFTWRGYDK